jgi:ABC-type cobalt transport system substrate-binding protein
MSKLHSILLILMIITAGVLMLLQKSRNSEVFVGDLESEEQISDLESDLAVSMPGIWQDESTEMYQIKYNLPQIDEIAKSDIERSVNDRVRAFMEDSNFESFTEEDKEFLGFNRGMKYTLEFNLDVKESVKIKTYILKTAVFTGGAHGNLELMSFNYDKASGKRLGLNDVFKKPATEYLPVLAALGDKFLRAEYGDVAFYDGLNPVPSNWSLWYATDDAIIFIFHPYQVVPWAYGTPELKVVAAGVSDFINIDYFTR